MKWFRMYTDILDDPKMYEMMPKTFKIFTFLLAFCSELDNSGSISVTKNKPKWRLRLRKREWENAINELITLNIISVEGDVLTILNWNKRQYKSDSSTERVQRYRSKERNVTETLHVTPPDTDKQKQKQKQRIKDKERKEISTNIYNHYKTKIKAGGSEDAKNSIAKLLLSKRSTEDELLKCVNNYLESLQIKAVEKRYYYQANNFFGQKSYWADYTDDVYETPDAEEGGLTDEERKIQAANKATLEYWNNKVRENNDSKQAEA